MNGERYDADEVRLAAQQAARTLSEALLGDVRGRIDLESSRCPSAQHKKRRSCVIDPSGLWKCFVCETGGDMLKMVALAKRLDIKRDFGAVLAETAKILGVRPVSSDPADAERRRRDVAERTAAERRRHELAQREKAELTAKAIAAAPGIWDGLARRHVRGERYVRDRLGQPIDRLLERETVRFHPNGDPAVALRDLKTGAVINVAQRRIGNDEPKVLVQKHGPVEGTLVGNVTELDDDGCDIAVLTEGIMDSLAAELAFPSCVALGANGAGNIPLIASAVLPRVQAERGWLFIVPHADGDEDGPGAGERKAVEAVRIAKRAGMRLGADLHIIDTLPNGDDLADAVRNGWRWSWA